MRILFINASPNKEGNTVRLAGKAYETLHLTDYKIYAYGQDYADDQFDEVMSRIREADTVVMGPPLYWHNICSKPLPARIAKQVPVALAWQRPERSVDRIPQAIRRQLLFLFKSRISRCTSP